mmetsp:Transcript_15262/g.42719  ORF Transcript_15262/g.42719 Transcript_15262/m.42719 type:complete len:237 (-) Transcript_15262:919-1629(-)
MTCNYNNGSCEGMAPFAADGANFLTRSRYLASSILKAMSFSESCLSRAALSTLAALHLSSSSRLISFSEPTWLRSLATSASLPGSGGAVATSRGGTWRLADGGRLLPLPKLDVRRLKPMDCWARSSASSASLLLRFSSSACMLFAWSAPRGCNPTAAPRTAPPVVDREPSRLLIKVSLSLSRVSLSTAPWAAAICFFASFSSFRSSEDSMSVPLPAPLPFLEAGVFSSWSFTTMAL